MSSAAPTIRGVFRTDLNARAAYSEGAGIYRIVPEAVAIPADVRDVVHLIKWAAFEGRAITARGAGSAMGGGNVGSDVLMDVSQLAPREVDINASALTARVSANATWSALHTAAGAHGLRLPPDPSSGRWATIGGMVATNAAGARSVRYGSIRPWVNALEMVTADGECVRLQRGRAAPAAAKVTQRFVTEVAPRLATMRDVVATRFPRTRKNSSGYAVDEFLRTGDLLDLVIGSEGTLGIITCLELRLDRVPRASGALRIALSSLEHLQPAVEMVSQESPSAVELIDRTFLDLVSGDNVEEFSGVEAILLVEVEGADQQDLAERLQRAATAATPHALSVETAVSAEDAEQLWAVRHAASPMLARLPETRRSLQVIEDGCVPLASMGEYIRGVRAAATRHGVAAVLFGHAGDGHLHCNLLPDVTEPDWTRRVAAILDEVTTLVAQLSGTVSGEHGDGRLRASLLPRTFGDELVSLFSGIKHAFDPGGILNPGIKLGDDAPLAQLKVGTDAAALPERIEAGLRAIEREAAYAMPRLQLLD